MKAFFKNSIFLALCIFSYPLQSQVIIDLETIGNPGNPPDVTGYGAVEKIYQIGKTDVTVDQYCKFLNAVATTPSGDSYGLYNANMGFDNMIYRTMHNGKPLYWAAPSRLQFPVTHVSSLSCARFCNWLHHGQPIGSEGPDTTETGAYYLNGAIKVTDSSIFELSSDATYFLPTENQWYKAAYYKGNGQYWKYATGSDTPPGNDIDGSPNQANIFSNGSFVVASAPHLTPVGFFTGSKNAYGLYDMGGNVNQWFTTVDDSGTIQVGFRGGDWSDPEQDANVPNIYPYPSASLICSDFRDIVAPEFESNTVGFRVAAPQKSTPDETPVISLPDDSTNPDVNPPTPPNVEPIPKPDQNSSSYSTATKIGLGVAVIGGVCLTAFFAPELLACGCLAACMTGSTGSGSRINDRAARSNSNDWVIVNKNEIPLEKGLTAATPLNQHESPLIKQKPESLSMQTPSEQIGQTDIDDYVELMTEHCVPKSPVVQAPPRNSMRQSSLGRRLSGLPEGQQFHPDPKINEEARRLSHGVYDSREIVAPLLTENHSLPVSPVKANIQKLSLSPTKRSSVLAVNHRGEPMPKMNSLQLFEHEKELREAAKKAKERENNQAAAKSVEDKQLQQIREQRQGVREEFEAIKTHILQDCQIEQEGWEKWRKEKTKQEKKLINPINALYSEAYRLNSKAMVVLVTLADRIVYEHKKLTLTNLMSYDEMDVKKRQIFEQAYVEPAKNEVIKAVTKFEVINDLIDEIKKIRQEILVSFANPATPDGKPQPISQNSEKKMSAMNDLLNKITSSIGEEEPFPKIEGKMKDVVEYSQQIKDNFSEGLLITAANQLVSAHLSLNITEHRLAKEAFENAEKETGITAAKLADRRRSSLDSRRSSFASIASNLTKKEKKEKRDEAIEALQDLQAARKRFSELMPILEEEGWIDPITLKDEENFSKIDQKYNAFYDRLTTVDIEIIRKANQFFREHFSYFQKVFKDALADSIEMLQAIGKFDFNEHDYPLSDYSPVKAALAKAIETENNLEQLNEKRIEATKPDDEESDEEGSEHSTEDPFAKFEQQYDKS